LTELPRLPSIARLLRRAIARNARNLT